MKAVDILSLQGDNLPAKINVLVGDDEVLQSLVKTKLKIMSGDRVQNAENYDVKTMHELAGYIQDVSLFGDRFLYLNLEKKWDNLDLVKAVFQEAQQFDDITVIKSPFILPASSSLKSRILFLAKTAFVRSLRWDGSSVAFSISSGLT